MPHGLLSKKTYCGSEVSISLGVSQEVILRKDYKDNCVVTIGYYEQEFFSLGVKIDWLRFLRRRLPEEDLSMSNLFEKVIRSRTLHLNVIYTHLPLFLKSSLLYLQYQIQYER